MSQPDWTFVFCDAVTDTELAVLPMVGVSFEKVLNGTGKLTGMIPTASAAVRAMDPWAASTPRRTCVYVYYGDTLLWGGMIWQRQRSHDSLGLTITAATMDSWLATQILLTDIAVTDSTSVALVQAMMDAVAAVPGGDLRFTVSDVSPPGTVLTPRTRNFPRVDVKDMLTNLGTLLTAEVPIEWRIDCERRSDGAVIKNLLIGEPRLGRTTDLSGLVAWHAVGHAGSTLLTFTDVEDGAVQSNAAAGSVPDPNGTNEFTQRLWAYHTAADLGVDEIGEGWPVMMRGVATMDRHVVTQADLDDVVLGAVADGMSQGKSSTNYSLRFDAIPLESYDVGDDLDVQITHPAYPDFPEATTNTLRILGRKITPRGPDTADAVDLTVWDGDSARLPRSTTLVAHMRDLIRRVKALETY